MAYLQPLVIINGIDFSAIPKDVAAITVTYEKREGNNGGLMKNGDMTVDILAWKAVIKIETKGIASSWIPTLLNEMMNDYVEVTFIDPRTNSQRTGTFIPDVVEVPMSLFIDGDFVWANSTSIILTER